MAIDMSKNVSRYDAFISYSSKDKDIVAVVVAALENKGVACWVAPRDIPPGKEWSESIIKGIEQSAAFVLIFSTNANESKQVFREVERAIAKGIPVLPFRIEDVAPSKALEYFISAQQWLNAYTPPIQGHANNLADKIRQLTGGSSPAQTVGPQPERAETASPRDGGSKRGGPTPIPAGGRRMMALVGLSVLLMLACAAVVGILALGPGNLFSRSTTTTTSTAAQAQPQETVPTPTPPASTTARTQPQTTGPAPMQHGTGKEPARLTAPFTAQQAKDAQTAWAKYLKREVDEEIDLGDAVKLELVLIPPGTFVMGSPPDEKERNPHESAFDAEKQHTVTITRPFYLGKCAVTQEQYEKIAGKNPSYFQAEGDGKEKVKGLDTSQFPVEMVWVYQAEEFCNKATNKCIWGTMVLPTDAQWEYACRAGTETAFHFGAENNAIQCNCNGDMPYGTYKHGPNRERIREARAYPPNAFGLYQMHGNVYQFCADYYASNEKLNKEDPVQLIEGKYPRHVFRGGAWDTGGTSCRAAFRNYLGECANNIGFRVCVRPD